jgi:hypothetical protein
MAKKRKQAAVKQPKENSKSAATATSKLNSTSVATFQSFPSELVPSLPRQALSLKELHPGSVWVVPNFLTPKECASWIDFCEGCDGLEYTSHPATNYMAQRECYRMQEMNGTQISEPLYRRLQESGVVARIERELDAFAKKKPPYRPVGFNPNIRLYKYTKGHAFGKHVDGSNRVDGVGQTEITILVYLSDCKGGATRFYPPRRKKSIAFDPEPGAMLLHVHGDNCLEHEGDEVLDGIKYVLRTDMVFSSV